MALRSTITLALFILFGTLHNDIAAQPFVRVKDVGNNYRAVRFYTNGPLWNETRQGDWSIGSWERDKEVFFTRPAPTGEYTIFFDFYSPGNLVGAIPILSQPNGGPVISIDYNSMSQYYTLTVDVPRADGSTLRASQARFPRMLDTAKGHRFNGAIVVDNRGVYVTNDPMNAGSGVLTPSASPPAKSNTAFFLAPVNKLPSGWQPRQGSLVYPQHITFSNISWINKALTGSQITNLIIDFDNFTLTPPPTTFERSAPKQYTGNTVDKLGPIALSPTFSITADVRIDQPQTWIHLVEIGGEAFGMSAPLRLQTGNEGVWYGALNDGISQRDFQVQGQWKKGQTFNFLLTYDRGTAKLYENGTLLGQFRAPNEMQRRKDILILGSHKGSGRYLTGQMSNVRIVPSLLQPASGPGATNSPSTTTPPSTPQPPQSAPVTQIFERPMPKTYMGNTVDNIGEFKLAPTFSFAADVRIDRSQRWIHLVEVGGSEFGMNAPFRLETGNEGEWYVALDNGQGIVDFTQQGRWKFGQTVNVLFTYENGVCKLYENGVLIGQLQGPPNVDSRKGQLILGSHKGTERFLAGQMSNVALKPQLIQPPPPPPPPLYENASRQVFNGQTTHNLGLKTLPASFTLSANVTVANSDQWRHLIEVGCLERGFHAPFRLEVGNQGQWYFAIGDGLSYVDADFQGAWRFNQPVNIVLTYANGIAKFYENGQLLREVPVHKNVSAMPGSLILGSFKGTERFFQGEMQNIVLRAGEHPPR